MIGQIVLSAGPEPTAEPSSSFDEVQTGDPGIHITGMTSYSTSAGCSSRDMNSWSGDDGGVVYMGGSTVYYEGDTNTVGMPVDLSTIHFSESDKLGSVFSELKANKVYRIKNGNQEWDTLTGNSATAGSAVAYLQCLPNLWSQGAPAEVALPGGLRMANEKYNIFAGYGTAAFKDVNNHWQLIELNDCGSTPTVTDLGLDTGSTLSNMQGCERGRQNGVLEQGAAGIGAQYSVLYACGGGNFCRKSLPSGNSATAFAFGSTYHSDTCSITIDLSTQRYFWHSEGTNGMTEPMYQCPLTFGRAPSSLAHCNLSATTGGIESTFWYTSSHQSPATGHWLDENNHPHPQPITFMQCPDHTQRTRQSDISPAKCEVALESIPGSRLRVKFKLIESDNNLGVQVYDGLSAISQSVRLPF